ncbi:MAG: O-antigen ligase family protein [Acidimicrobiales bacterium]
MLGLVVLLWLARARTVLRAGAPVFIGAAVAWGALVPSLPESGPAYPLPAAAGLAAGVAVATWSSASPRRLGGVAAGLVVLAAGTVVASGALGRVADRRLNVTSSERHGETAAAVRLAVEHPVFGVGPSFAEFVWTDEDGRPRRAEFAHNEYLQIAAELGFIGAGLLVYLLVCGGRLVAAPRARAGVDWPGAAAGLVAVAVHAAFDFGWHVPAVALTGALLVGISIAPNNRRQHEEASVEPDRRGGCGWRRDGTGDPLPSGGGDPLAGRVSP